MLKSNSLRPFHSARDGEPFDFTHGSTLLTVPEQSRREGRELIERQRRAVGMTVGGFSHGSRTLVVPSPYSCRRTVFGSSNDARRAGTNVPRAATATSAVATSATSPKLNDETLNAAAVALLAMAHSSNPMTAPTPGSRLACPRLVHVREGRTVFS